MQTKLLMKDKRFSNLLQTFGSQIIILIVTLISGVLLARGLGPEGRGQYISITMWANLLYWALSFGVYQTVLYYWRSYENSKKIIFTTLLVYSVFFCCLAVLVAQLIVVPLVMSDYSEDIILAGRIYFFGIIYSAFSDVLMAALAGDEEFKYSNMLRVSLPGLTTLIMTLLFFTDNFTITNALYVSFVMLSSLFLLNLWKIKQKGLFSKQVDWKLMLSAFKYSSKSHGGNVAGLASVNSTQIILSVFLHPSMLGIYATAQSSITPLNAITTTVGITLQPMLTAENRNVIHLRAMKIIRNSILVIGVCSCMLGIILPFAIPFVYGAEFLAAIMPALIMLPSLLLNSISNTYRNALNGIGKTFINTKTEVIVLIVTGVLLYIFLEQLGLIGAAIVTTLSSIVRLLVFFREYKKVISITSFGSMLPRLEDVKETFEALAGLLKKTFNKSYVKRNSA
ncbi:lipopolysaccharide biosynthesis protein [Paenibacillus lemnae]|uniref:Oligosaccharide flippase family protein n=1 Tax=Paenibacillus lemnae TaxID=1330551 RepID=A0A848M663_PAELE|nr:polysaccharide biosynthesis C-terminal domain-containing protein [Paenibacillus lemnae]NMO95711.1 oligosaccharide flippase family protein [Paenibacillus lemnae]